MTDEQDIRNLIDRWHKATAAGDAAAVGALMTEDVVFLTPGQPPMDKAGFMKGFASFAGKVRFESKFEIRELVTSGDLATCWTHIELTMTDRKSVV